MLVQRETSKEQLDFRLRVGKLSSIRSIFSQFLLLNPNMPIRKMNQKSLETKCLDINETGEQDGRTLAQSL